MSEIITFAPTTAGGGNEFVVPFPYLLQSHVKLYVNGVEDTGKTWPSDGTIRASVAITAGDIVVVKRETPRADLLTTLPTSGTLSSDDMNEQSLQAVYVATEAADGLREGLALDEATETYWEGAPTGVNRIMKNVVDPSAAQEAITKGWYDGILDTHVSNAQTSAGDAATAAAGAAADVAATASAATAALADAALAEAANDLAQEELASYDGTPEQWSAAAEDWAQEAEDTPISTTSGGDGVTTFSAFHWNAKSSDAAVAAQAAQTAAEAAAERLLPWASSDLLGDDEGFAINWIGQNISIRDYGDASKMLINKPFLQAQRDGDIANHTPAGNDVAQWSRFGRYGNHSGDNVSTQWFGPTYSELTNMPVGRMYGNVRSYTAIPHEMGNGVYYQGTDTNVTRNANVSHNNPRLFNGRNTTRLQTTATTGIHNTNSQIGRSGNNAVSGLDLKLVFIGRQGTHNEAYLRFYDDFRATDYGCQIDLSDGSYAADGSHFSNMFDSVSVYPLPGGFYRYDCIVPRLTGDLDFNNAYIQVGLRSGASFSWTGTGTENIYVDYFGALTGHGRGILVINRIAIGGGAYRVDADGPAGSLDGSYPTLGHLGYCSWWTIRYCTEKRRVEEQLKPLAGWADASAGHFYAYLDTDGSLKVNIEDATGSSETWDTGVDITLDDTANNGYGTKVGVLLSLDENAVSDQVKLWYRVNDGTVNSLTRTLTTATGTFQTIDGSACYAGTGTDSDNYNGFMYVYDGYFTHVANDQIASRYLKLHTHDPAW